MQEASELFDSVLPDAFKGDAHSLLIALYKDTGQPVQVRLDAAKAAIAYEKPKLQAIEHSGDPDNPLATRTRIEVVVVDTGVPRGPLEGDSDLAREH